MIKFRKPILLRLTCAAMLLTAGLGSSDSATAQSSPKQAAGSDQKSQSDKARTDSLPESQVRWVSEGSQKKIVIQVGSGLTQKQLATLNSGFSTFSRLTIARPQDFKNQKVIQFAAITACTVKFDMWEERYEMALIKDPPESLMSKNLHMYLDRCLQAEVSSPEILNQLNKSGGKLVVLLEVEQISSSQALKIKEWLIGQQSTVMRGLFTHMLGEMTLSATSRLTLNIPPYR